MARMTNAEIEAYLQEPLLVAILSVSRPTRGPVAIPMWYEYRDALFWIHTSPRTIHARLALATGRVTLTVRSETNGGSTSHRRYVMAEGPFAFTDDELEPLVRRLRRRYYVGDRADEWVSRPLSANQLTERVAVVRPEGMAGFHWVSEL